jgi:hypothetical protein
VPSRVVSARGALRRSLVLWGWGQVSTGDRRGWLGPPAQSLALVGLALAAPWAGSTAAPLVFVAVALVGVAWVAIAVHAWRRAAWRRAAIEAPPGGGAADLLALAPLVVLVGAGFWIVGGPGADPALTLDAYLNDWETGRAAAASRRFVSPPSTEALQTAWERQDVALRNAVVRIAAAEPGALVRPDRPLEGLRWVDLGQTSKGGRAYAVEVAREETVRGLVLDLFPTTSRRLVTVERLGIAELRPVAAGGGGLFGAPPVWRVVRVEIAGEGVAAAGG